MFQLFSTKKSHDLQPLQLNNTAKLYQEQGTSFLAFNKPVLKDVAVEYQLADDYTAKSVDQPLRITDQGNALDNTFAKKGVFALRYGDRGKDISQEDHERVIEFCKKRMESATYPVAQFYPDVV